MTKKNIPSSYVDLLKRDQAKRAEYAQTKANFKPIKWIGIVIVGALFLRFVVKEKIDERRRRESFEISEKLINSRKIKEASEEDS